MVMGALGGAFVLYSLPVGTPAVVIILLTILASVIFGMLYLLTPIIRAIVFDIGKSLPLTNRTIINPIARAE